MPTSTVSTGCCIVGGGPAGMMLGLLLARAGIDTVVLEKHGDFFRDFRGDTIHPSTIDLLDQLGLRDRFDAITQSHIHTLDVVVNGNRLTPVDFSHLKAKNDYIALMPQWDFLSLLTESMLITIPREGYYQAGMLIPKGEFAAVQEQGIPAFRARIIRAAPFLAEVTDSIESWDQVKLLTVQVNRLTQWWQDGLLCIGDAAHAMSPAFGVGINYAIQDAVATANLLVKDLRSGIVPVEHLARVQKRRFRPVARMQPLQLRMHKVIAKPGGGAFLANPMRWWQRAIAAVLLPILRRVTAKIVGRGFRPEAIQPQLDRPPIG